MQSDQHLSDHCHQTTSIVRQGHLPLSCWLPAAERPGRLLLAALKPLPAAERSPSSCWLLRSWFTLWRAPEAGEGILWEARVDAAGWVLLCMQQKPCSMPCAHRCLLLCSHTEARNVMHCYSPAVSSSRVDN